MQDIVAKAKKMKQIKVIFNVDSILYFDHFDMTESTKKPCCA